jgi:hypothetical protein
MSGRIFISHSAADARLGHCIAEFLSAMIEGAQVRGSSLPGREPLGGDDTLAALKQQLASADVVIGVITPHALASGEVPFQLGAAWSLGTRLMLLLTRDGGAPELYLPMGHAEALVLGPEALLELAASLANAAGLRAEASPRARAVLSELFPDFAGFDRESSERAIGDDSHSGTTQQLWPIAEDGSPAPRSAPAPRPGLPSCSASLLAGRALSDCVFHRDVGSGFADELDMPFGAFLSALGSDWSALRELADLDVWREVAENVLGALSAGEDHVRAFYEMGFQLGVIVNLANTVLERGDAAGEELSSAWRDAWLALRGAALAARVELAQVEALEALVANLFAPKGQRDFANLGRVQEWMREAAAKADAARSEAA